MFNTGSDSGRIRRLLRAAMPVTPPPNLRSIPCKQQEGGPARHGYAASPRSFSWPPQSRWPEHSRYRRVQQALRLRAVSRKV